MSAAEAYADGARPRLLLLLLLLLLDGVEDSSIDGMTASAIAINVAHCDSVRISPSGGEGRGVSRGPMRFNCVLVIVFDIDTISRALGKEVRFDSDHWMNVYSIISRMRGNIALSGLLYGAWRSAPKVLHMR